MSHHCSAKLQQYAVCLLKSAALAALADSVIKGVGPSAGLSVSYSSTITVGQSTSVSVSAAPGYHATITAGELRHVMLNANESPHDRSDWTLQRQSCSSTSCLFKS